MHLKKNNKLSSEKLLLHLSDFIIKNQFFLCINTKYTQCIALIRSCLENKLKYDLGNIDNLENIIAVLHCDNIEYSIIAKHVNNKLVLYFPSSSHYQKSFYECFKNVNFFKQIFIVITYFIFYLFDFLYLFDYLKGLLFNDCIKGVRDRNSYNKSLFLCTIHYDLYDFIYQLTLWMQSKKIKHIVLEGVSSGGSFALFSIGEFMKSLLENNYKVNNIDFVGLSSSGLNDLSMKILIQNIANYIRYNSNIQCNFVQLVCHGDCIYFNGRIFPSQKFVKDYCNNIKCFLFIINPYEHEYWKNGKFISKKFMNSYIYNNHFISSQNYFQYDFSEVYVMNNIKNIESWIHLCSGGCGCRCVGDNKKLLHNFCNLVGINTNSLFANSVEYENIKQYKFILENYKFKINNINDKKIIKLIYYIFQIIYNITYEIINFCIICIYYFIFIIKKILYYFINFFRIIILKFIVLIIKIMIFISKKYYYFYIKKIEKEYNLNNDQLIYLILKNNYFFIKDKYC